MLDSSYCASIAPTPAGAAWEAGVVVDTEVSKSDGESLAFTEEGESGRLAKEGKLQASNNRNESVDKSMPAKFGRNHAMVGRLLTPRASQIAGRRSVPIGWHYASCRKRICPNLEAKSEHES